MNPWADGVESVDDSLFDIPRRKESLHTVSLPAQRERQHSGQRLSGSAALDLSSFSHSSTSDPEDDEPDTCWASTSYTTEEAGKNSNKSSQGELEHFLETDTDTPVSEKQELLKQVRYTQETLSGTH